ncbi:MAG TPA: translation elongation factor G, partial [Clostridiales bacterium]|nr:translation elongation factor G [Clostridiales bacterium]
KGIRLTCMKITGGSLKNRNEINGEKVTGIRIYSGAKFEAVDEAAAGTVCAVQGLSETSPGQGLGCESKGAVPILEPVMAYRINLPKGVDARTALPKLRQLEDEDPMLRIMWNEQLRQIRVQLMGRVQ